MIAKEIGAQDVDVLKVANQCNMNEHAARSMHDEYVCIVTNIIIHINE